MCEVTKLNNIKIRSEIEATRSCSICIGLIENKQNSAQTGSTLKNAILGTANLR
jgi:hypothetical protein